MKTIIRSIIAVFILGASYFTLAQQQAQYSLYMMNNYTLNPAVGGTENYTDLKASFRQQWTGFEGAPRNFYISGHTSLNKQTPQFDDIKPMPFHGVGGYIYSDNTGPTTKLGAYGSYAFHLPITNMLTASFGAFVGLQQYRVDSDQLKFHDDQFGVNDNAINGLSTKFLPDAHVGIWLYHKNYYAGLALYQLFNNQLDFESVPNASTTGKLNKHYFFTAGYRVPLTDDFTLVPSFVVKAVSPAPAQFDINAKLRYKQLVWAGVSYRNRDAIVLLVGGTIKNKIDVGYAYDITTSNIRNHSAGSHEIIIGYRIPTHNDVEPTSQFW